MEIIALKRKSLKSKKVKVREIVIVANFNGTFREK